MSAAIDICLLAIIIASAVFGFVKGFFRSIMGFCSIIIAYFMASSLYKVLAIKLGQLPFLYSMTHPEILPEADDIIEAINSEKGIIASLTRAIKELLALGTGSLDDTASALFDIYLGTFLANALSFIIVFVVSLIILKLLVLILDYIFKAPILNISNKLLGAAFGLFYGLVLAWLISTAFVKFGLPFLTAQWPQTFNESFANSAVMKFCTSLNPLKFILTFIEKITS